MIERKSSWSRKEDDIDLCMNTSIRQSSDMVRSKGFESRITFDEGFNEIMKPETKMSSTSPGGEEVLIAKPPINVLNAVTGRIYGASDSSL